MKDFAKLVEKQIQDKKHINDIVHRKDALVVDLDTLE